jgi:tRNA/rRNA methyltransferase
MTAEPQQPGLLHGSAIILVRPKYPENIGASARVALNFGIGQIIVVRNEAPDNEKMLKMATHKAADLIHNMKLFKETAEAATPYQFIVGTTARQGRHRILEQTPHEVMAQVAPLAKSNRIALMFGPENSGLTNSELDLCQFMSTIPTADFSSLNLAQAVGIHCYELSMAITSAVTRPLPDSDFANSFELEGMYEHIERTLTTTTYLEENSTSYWMRNIRQFLSRTRVKKKEASMIRGMCRKFLWHYEKHGTKQVTQENLPE